MSIEEAILLLEHTCYDDFNLLDYQIKGRLEAIKVILKENQELKDRLNTYENPEDLTLMFMYCDEKAKDKIKCLEQENQQLKEKIKNIVTYAYGTDMLVSEYEQLCKIAEVK